MKVVWILGAGFSASLGGPLLGDLFTGRLLGRVVARFGPLSQRLKRLHGHYSDRRKASDEFKPQASRNWRNPEEFLEILERGAEEGASESIRRLTLMTDQREIREYATSARLYLAAACHHFVPDSKADLRVLEAWRPYTRWGGLLRPNDAILSFNYDCVVERAVGLDRLLVPCAWDRASLSEEHLQLLKLHGSVTWARDASGGHTVLEDPERAILDGKDFLLGVPGPSKLDASRTHDPLWRCGERAIESADVIVMMGYRFAETDNEAKRRLLGALARNKQPGLTIRIVLGPNTAHEDVRRVRGLFEWAVRGRGSADAVEARREWGDRFGGNALEAAGSAVVIDAVPMYAQDFLAVFEREHLSHWQEPRARGEAPNP